MANTYITHTPSNGGTPGTQKFTLSFWIKRSKLGVTQRFLGAYTSANLNTNATFNSNDTFQFYNRNTNAGDKYFVTNRVFRDTSAWYHFVIAIDSTLSTEADRVKFYVNGVEETSFSEVYEPPQNYEYRWGEALAMNIGQPGTNADYFDGSISHFHYIDGTQYAASAFGSTDSTTGEWKINATPSVTYGNDGYFILKNGNSVTDQSGNSNNFTVAGGTLTKTEDNPSNNFATVNAVIGNHSNGNALQPTLENANTVSVYGSGEWRIAQSTLGASSGKYYAEIKWIEDSNTRYSYIGLYDVDGYAQKISGYPYMADMANCYGLKDSNGNINSGASSTSYGVSYGAGNIIGVAMDLDNNKLYFSKDGVWMNSANPSNGTGGYSITANKTYVIGIQQYAVGYLRFAHNYGNGYFQTTAVSSAGSNASNLGIFEYDVPTGFTALCTKGLNE